MKYTVAVCLFFILLSCGGDDPSEGVNCVLTEAGLSRFIRCDSEIPETERIIKREVTADCEECDNLLEISLRP